MHGLQQRLKAKKVEQMMTLTETVTERQMTNTDQNLPPRRELPVSTVQLAAITSDAVISGLGKSPYLLGLIVLTAIGVGAAIYFLQILITGQSTHLNNLLQQQTKQQSELLAMHKAEFEALLEMSNRLTAVPPPIARAKLANSDPAPATSKEVAMNEDTETDQGRREFNPSLRGLPQERGRQVQGVYVSSRRADDRPRPHEPSREEVQCNYSMDP